VGVILGAVTSDFPQEDGVAERVSVRAISNEEGQRLLRMVRRSSGCRPYTCDALGLHREAAAGIPGTAVAPPLWRRTGRTGVPTLSAPLRAGERAVGVLTVRRRLGDVGGFGAESGQMLTPSPAT